MKIAHLTTVHRRDDTRILLKQCRSLAEAGHDVTLVVADGLGDEIRHGVRIVDAGRASGRLDRMSRSARRVRDTALDLGSEVCHVHDPELLPAAVYLKRAGRRVIYDAHEDYPRHVLSKHYLHPWVRRPAARFMDLLERWAGPRVDAIVAATPPIAERLRRFNSQTVTVANFPILDEMTSEGVRWSDRRSRVAYVGSITRVRGAVEIVDALACCRTDVTLAMAGTFAPADLLEACRRRPGWSRVEATGHLDRGDVKRLLQTAIAGLVVLHGIRNHVDSQPVKLFEYMSAGLPVIASDFPLWTRIVTDADCGILVDPLDPKAIAAAIDRLIDHPDEAERMGRNGRDAVLKRFNWSREEPALLDIYRRLE